MPDYFWYQSLPQAYVEWLKTQGIDIYGDKLFSPLYRTMYGLPSPYYKQWYETVYLPSLPASESNTPEGTNAPGETPSGGANFPPPTRRTEPIEEAEVGVPEDSWKIYFGNTLLFVSPKGIGDLSGDLNSVKRNLLLNIIIARRDDNGNIIYTRTYEKELLNLFGDLDGLIEEIMYETLLRDAETRYGAVSEEIDNLINSTIDNFIYRNQPFDLTTYEAQLKTVSPGALAQPAQKAREEQEQIRRAESSTGVTAGISAAFQGQVGQPSDYSSEADYLKAVVDFGAKFVQQVQDLLDKGGWEAVLAQFPNRTQADIMAELNYYLGAQTRLGNWQAGLTRNRTVRRVTGYDEQGQPIIEISPEEDIPIIREFDMPGTDYNKRAYELAASLGIDTGKIGQYAADFYSKVTSGGMIPGVNTDEQRELYELGQLATQYYGRVKQGYEEKKITERYQSLARAAKAFGTQRRFRATI